jgi:hypothetical protein
VGEVFGDFDIQHRNHANARVFDPITNQHGNIAADLLTHPIGTGEALRA